MNEDEESKSYEIPPGTQAFRDAFGMGGSVSIVQNVWKCSVARMRDDQGEEKLLIGIYLQGEVSEEDANTPTVVYALDVSLGRRLHEAIGELLT